MKPRSYQRSAGIALRPTLHVSALALMSTMMTTTACAEVVVELRECDTVLAATVGSGESTLTLTDAQLSTLSGNTVTNFMIEGSGMLVVPEELDLSGYVGDITIGTGVTYRFLSANGVGSATAGSIVVKDGGALEAAPPTGVKMNIGAKRVVFSGSGPDGKGALRSNPEDTVQDNGFIFGTNLVMSGDALISSLASKYTYIGANTGFSLDMNGQELEVRPYSGPGGKSSQTFVVRNPHITNPGRIRQTQATVQFTGGSFSLGGAAANVFAVTNAVTHGQPSLRLNKSGMGTPWTLEWDTPGNFDIVSTTPGVTTNENAWVGPVALKQNMNVAMEYGSDGYAQMTLGGKVSGEYGISVTRNPNQGRYPDSHINLVSPENDFSGPLSGTDITIHLWNSGALPENGAGIIGTNVTLRLEGKDAFALPCATLGGNSAIEGEFWRWTKGIVKTGDGRLVCSGVGCGSFLDVQGGTVAWDDNQEIHAARFAGVVSGARFFPSHEAALAAYESNELATNVVELSPSFAYDTEHDYWQTGNALITCRGYLWNGRATNETWSFVAAMGRKAKLTVNGTTLFENEFWIPNNNATSRMTCGYGDATIAPGANLFELRICTSAKQQGPSCRSIADSPQWLKSKYGFVVDTLGRNAIGNGVANAYNKYSTISDDGNGMTLSWAVHGTDSSYIHPETGATFALSPSFDRMAFGAGAALDCAGFDSYSAAKVEGFPTIANCGTFAITNEWTLPVSRLGGETLATDGRLDLAAATLSVDRDAVRHIETDTSFAVASAVGGISGIPTLSANAAEDWSVQLSTDGTVLLIIKKSPGFSVIIR